MTEKTTFINTVEMDEYNDAYDVRNLSQTELEFLQVATIENKLTYSTLAQTENPFERLSSHIRRPDARSLFQAPTFLQALTMYL